MLFLKPIAPRFFSFTHRSQDSKSFPDPQVILPPSSGTDQPNVHISLSPSRTAVQSVLL
jgi:hypothetical protein